MNNQKIKQRIVIFTIIILIALIHILRVGSYLSGHLYRLYYSYFSDIVIPSGFYYLLCSAALDIQQLNSWKLKLLISFLLPSLAETLQFFKIPILGSTFDPLDYLMFGFGSALAVVMETQLFPRIFLFWKNEAKN